jgi:hypothetical protein
MLASSGGTAGAGRPIEWQLNEIIFGASLGEGNDKTFGLDATFVKHVI